MCAWPYAQPHQSLHIKDLHNMEQAMNNVHIYTSATFSPS